MSVQQDKYFGIRPLEAGFKVKVHDENEVPLANEHGFAVMPGTATFVALKVTKVLSLSYTRDYFRVNNSKVRNKHNCPYTMNHCPDMITSKNTIDIT